VWVVNVTALVVIWPPVVTAFISRYNNSIFPFLQMCSIAYMTIVASVSMHVRFTRYSYLLPPFAVIWIVSVFFSNYRMITKLFQLVILGQTIMASLSLDNILTIGWDATLLPSFATATVSIYIIQAVIFWICNVARMLLCCYLQG
jgi:hypothetical protein